MIGPFDGSRSGSGGGAGPFSGSGDSSDTSWSPFGSFESESDDEGNTFDDMVRNITDDAMHAKFARAKATADAITGTSISDAFAAGLANRSRGPATHHHRLALPHTSDGGIETAVTVLEHLHRPPSGVLGFSFTRADAHAVEYHYDADTGEISTHLFFGSDRASATFDDLAFESFPNSAIQHAVSRHPKRMFRSGRGIAAASLATIRSLVWPIRQAIDTEKAGFSPSMRVGTDSLAALFGALARDPSTSIIVQIVYEPITLSGPSRFRAGRRIDRLRNGDETSDAARAVAHRKLSQRLYAADVRVVATSDPNARSGSDEAPPQRAATAVSNIAAAFDAFDHRNQVVKQGFGAMPITGFTDFTMRTNLKEFVRSTLDIVAPGRAANGGQSSTLSLAGLAGTAHVPGDLDNRRIARSVLSAGNPVPSSLPKFPWDDVGIDPNTATIDEKARAIYLNQHLSDDVFYGVCVRDGIEVGIPWLPTDEKAHTITSGASSNGKTSTLHGKQFQVTSKGRAPLTPIAEREYEHAVTDLCERIDPGDDVHAALADLAAKPPETSDYSTINYDPKGKDTPAALATHPGTPADTIVWTIGGDNPNGFEVGINPLQIPLDVGPGTREFTQLLEPRVEGMKALMALMGGGSDEFFGPRMNRVTDLVSRALSLAVTQGYQPSVSDFAGALLGEEKRTQLAADASKEREDFVGELASAVLDALNDSDIEPTLGRLTGIMISLTKLANIGRPENTFSFHDVLANGHDMFIEDRSVDERLGQSTAALIVIHVWMAVRELAADPTRPDPTPVEVFLDELPVIISKFSSLEDVLGQARAYDMHVDMAGQDYGNQLPDTIEGLARSQTDRAISFNPGTEDEDAIANQHTDDVTIEGLTDLPKYQAFIRTPNRAGELSPSLRTKMFNRPAEVLPDEYVRTPQQIQAFREASYRIHGAKELTNADVRQHSRYFDSYSDQGTGEGAGTIAFTSDDQTVLYKAIYDAQIRHADDPLSPQPIGFDVLADALRRALADVQDTTTEAITDSQIQSVKGHLKRAHLSETDDGSGGGGESTDYGYHVEPAGLGFLAQDDPDKADPRAGKKEHRRGVDHAYHWLTHFLDDCDVEIPAQGGETPDLHISDPFGFEAAGSALAAEKARQQFIEDHPLRAVLTGGNDTAVEFEHTTKAKQSSLVGKVRRTYEADEACLFVTWSVEDAHEVHDRLAPPAARREIPDPDPDNAHWQTVVLPRSASVDASSRDGSDGFGSDGSASAGSVAAGSDSESGSDGSAGSESDSHREPRLSLGLDGDPSLIALSNVSPHAVADALAEHTDTADASPWPGDIPEF